MKKTEKVILLHKNQWGEKYEIKELARGFSRYLLLQNQVVLANKKTLSWLEKQKAKQVQEELILEAKAREIYERLNNFCLSFTLKKGEKGEPFGSVGFKEILEELTKTDFHLEKSQLVDFHPLNKLGEHTMPVKLSSKLTANLKIIVK